MVAVVRQSVPALGLVLLRLKAKRAERRYELNCNQSIDSRVFYLSFAKTLIIFICQVLNFNLNTISQYTNRNNKLVFCCIVERQ